MAKKLKRTQILEYLTCDTGFLLLVACFGVAQTYFSEQNNNSLARLRRAVYSERYPHFVVLHMRS